MINSFYVPLTKKQKQDLIKFCQNVYPEVDDEELPEMVLNELYVLAYKKALMDIKKNMKGTLKDFIENEVKLMRNL